MRIKESSSNLPVVNRGKKINVLINGTQVDAYEGELVSTVLQAEGIYVFNHKHKTGKPSGIYCAMGVCYECLVTVDGVVNIRACQTFVKDQMEIQTSELVKP
jgi:sarcosine oxidase subunit alpha